MSMKKWRKLASEKAEVEQQNDSILAAIKNNKINKGFSLVSGEDLFKPITSRLDKLQVGDSNSVAEPKEEIPDYGMEDFDLNNPFDEDFRPDEETPPPTPSPSPTSSPPPSPTSSPPPSPTSSPPSPTSTPLPPLAEEEETELMEESGASPAKKPSKWGPPKEPVIRGSESVDLQTLSSMLTKNKDNPNYVVKSKKSKFYGYTLADIQEARNEILARRQGKFMPPTDWMPPPPDEDEREMEGSGSVDPNALVERLHISLASIQAGNTSLKLKKQVQQMLGLLVKLKEITQKEAHKILGSII